MNYRLKLALACILAVSTTSAYSADLLEVYKVAEQNDPLIREADATRLASREAKPQAWAQLLPLITADGSVSRTKTDNAGLRPTTFTVLGDPLLRRNDSYTATDNGSWGLSLTQTLFRWDRFVALGRADLQVTQAETAYRAAQQDLIVRVIQRYFAVLYAKDIVDTNDAALTAFTRQLEQAEKRFEVGLIAITDVQESRAQRDRASANLIDAKRTLATNHELLRELTGQDFEVLAAPIEDLMLNPPDPADVKSWIDTAMEQNLTLISARLAAEIANKNVSIARSGHLPTLDLSARYADSDDDTNTANAVEQAPPNPPSESRYDTWGIQNRQSIGLTLNVPLFAGGGTQSVVRQQVYTYRAARERVERSTRETERSVRDNYLGVLSNISRVQALKQAMESSKTSLQATQAGFDVGTRTTVDVLEGQRQLYVTQGDYYKSRYDYLVTRILLEQAAGSLNADDLAKINTNLQ
jgi:outer membrane protein